MSESAGLNFLRNLERRAQKLQGSIEVGTGDLILIIRDYARLETLIDSLTGIANPKCGNGHNDYPLTLWDCPVCVQIEKKKLEAKNATLKTYAQKLEGSHNYGDVLSWRVKLGLVQEMSEWIIPDKHREALEGESKT